MPWLLTVMAQPLLTHNGVLVMVALGALSVSTVVGHAAAYARGVAITIPIAMHCPKVHGCWATTGCFPLCPSHTFC